jgi:hypothetical protein
MKKDQKTFDKLLKKMNKLSEDSLGKLKGGVTVISDSNNSFLADNSGTCINHGSCDNEVNSGLCFNNKNDCPKQ